MSATFLGSSCTLLLDKAFFGEDPRKNHFPAQSLGVSLQSYDRPVGQQAAAVAVAAAAAAGDEPDQLYRGPSAHPRHH
ncbi:MAG: hypothetical protein Q7K20_10255 [Polaromonas sp.]|nr:hypothetical protein [Polaromonas sp.]